MNVTRLTFFADFGIIGIIRQNMAKLDYAEVGIITRQNTPMKGYFAALKIIMPTARQIGATNYAEHLALGF
jgi:hypothetical protein